MSDTNETGVNPEVDGAVVAEVKEEVVAQVLPEAAVVVMDDSAFDDEEREREEAYHAEPQWKGVVLQPFAISRQSFFDQHRVAVGAPELGVILGGGSLAFLADAIRILYLCSHDPADYRHLRCQPVLLQEEMERWADEHIDAEEDLKAVEVALQIFNGSQVNKAEAVPPGEPGSEDEMGN